MHRKLSSPVLAVLSDVPPPADKNVRRRTSALLKRVFLTTPKRNEYLVTREIHSCSRAKSPPTPPLDVAEVEKIVRHRNKHVDRATCRTPIFANALRSPSISCSSADAILMDCEKASFHCPDDSFLRWFKSPADWRHSMTIFFRFRILQTKAHI